MAGTPRTARVPRRRTHEHPLRGDRLRLPHPPRADGAPRVGPLRLAGAAAVAHARQGRPWVAICPGTVETEGMGKLPAPAPAPAAARQPLAARQLAARLGSPAPVAAMVAFVAGA